MKSLMKVLAVVAATAAGSATGCATASGPKTCSLVGCEAGLAIEVRGDRGGDVTVKVTAADGQTKSFECDADVSGCSTFIPDFMPENVTVTVTKKEGNFVKSYAVAYNNVHPNGDDCPPVCRQGHIDVLL
ncbi:MAG: hypothetical protein ABIV28_05980 [Longimicrobiales bacterium]